MYVYSITCSLRAEHWDFMLIWDEVILLLPVWSLTLVDSIASVIFEQSRLRRDCQKENKLPCVSYFFGRLGEKSSYCERLQAVD